MLFEFLRIFELLRKSQKYSEEMFISYEFKSANNKYRGC